jgi:hypothetical protein
MCAGCVFNRCDDSSGAVATIFRVKATSVFAGFASRYADKPRLESLLEELLLSAPYGACDRLSVHILEMLPEDAVRRMIARFTTLAKEEPNTQRASLIQCSAKALAEGLGDPRLYLEISTPEGPNPTI